MLFVQLFSFYQVIYYKQCEIYNVSIDNRQQRKSSQLGMYRVHPKHHQHIFSPLTMLYNYVKQTKQSINDFFNQYLKQQGRSTLINFNRYMILIVILNIDIKFLILISLIAFITVKILKLKPWQKNKYQQLPISYALKLNQIKKKQLNQSNIKRYKSQDKQQQNTNIAFNSKNSLKQNIHKSAQNNINKGNPLNINNNKPQQSISQSNQNSYNSSNSLKNQEKDLKSTIITNIESTTIQQQIYQWLQRVMKMYCKFIWFVKTKSILFMWAILIVIYLFQPNLQNDSYHIVTSIDGGVLQIQSIKTASQYVNYFQLIFLWVLINALLFYRHGTKQLKTQLLQQLYTKQYTYNLIKQKKLKTKRLYSKADQNIIKTNSIFVEDPFSQKKYNTFILKKKSPVDLQQLIDFSHPKPASHHDDSQFINSRKLSHDLLSPLSPFSHRQTKKTKQNIEIQFVESQEQKSQNQDNNQFQYFSKQKIPLDKKNSQLNEQQSAKNTIPSSKIVMHQTPQKKKILQRKNTFLPTNSTINQNNLQRKKKASQQINIQDHSSAFKISLLKVQVSETNKHKLSKKS